MSITNIDSDDTTDQLLVLNLTTDSVGIRSFAQLAEQAGVGEDTLQSVTERGDSTDRAINLKQGLTINNLPVDNLTTTVLVLTGEDSVAIREFASLDATVQETLQTVTERGDSTDRDILIRNSLTADSVKASVGFFDTNNIQLIIYDSAGSILWGA